MNIPWSRSLKARLGGIVAVIALLMVGMIAINIATLSSLRGASAKTNLFGRGHTYFVELQYLIDDLLDANSSTRAAARTRIREIIQLNDQRVEKLFMGDPANEMSPVMEPAVLAPLQENRELWTQREKPLLEQAIDANSPEEARNAAERLKTDLSTSVRRVAEMTENLQASLQEEVDDAKLYQYYLLGISAIILGLILWIVQGITRRVRVVMAAAERIADGDLNQKIEITGSDEVAVLGGTFNTMADSLRALLGTIAETANNLASASSELLAGTTQQSSSAQEQAAAVTETVSTVNEVQQTSEQAAERAKAVAGSAHRAAEIGKAGLKAVEESVTAMAAVKEQTESIADNILALAERAQAIGEIIATVNDVAEQTNLLALNAGIEASRAGEHGAGFTVVAREIKDLADQAKKATAQVRQILGDIQKATNGAVMTTEEGMKSVNATMKAIDRAGETIRTLAATVDEAATAASQITASAAQQATGMGQVQQAMRDINQATNQNIASTKQAEQAAQDLNALGAKLKKLLAA